MFSKNPDDEEICKVDAVLHGDSSVKIDLALTPADLANMKYSPITTCDVECSFSQYKSIF